MSEREILVADSDSMIRRQMAESFRNAGYDVETTDSAVHVFCTVLEKRIPVVLLGSGFDNKMALTDMVRLLKECNRHLTIILVSDNETLSVMRTIRQEGIFYHALKPAGQGDTAEILSAVECAFNKTGRNEEKQTNRPAENYVAAPVVDTPCSAGRMTNQASDEVPESVTSNTTIGPRHGEEMKMRAKAAAIIAMLTAAVAGFVYCVIAATKGKESGDLVIWGFLGFCALIVVGQLLPAFFSVRAAKKVLEQQLQEQLAVKGEKQQAYAVFDKNE
jgi:DNA-binding response OmpR family regulator